MVERKAGRRGANDSARPVIKDVAQHAGVAPSSVSRVLSSHPSVSATLREKVMASVRALGYSPDLLAQGLRRQRTGTVGFVASDISNPLISQIVSGAEQRLRSAGYAMLLTNSEGDPSRDAEHMELLERRRVDGLLLSLSSEQDEATLEALGRRTAPVVLIDREVEGSEHAAVLSDHQQGMSEAVECLIGLGHSRIGLVLGPDVRPARERARVLLEACATSGGRVECVVERDLLADHQHATASVRRLLAGPQRCTALVVGSNQLLPLVLATMTDLGFSLGVDLAMVVCDRTAVTEVVHPALGAVFRDNEALGFRAADLLLAQVEGAEGAARVVLPTSFEPGLTCTPPT